MGMKTITGPAISVAFLLFLSESPLHAERIPVAVFNLRAAGVSSATAEKASLLVRRGIAAIPRFGVIDPTNSGALLRKSNIDIGSCTDRRCAVKACARLGAVKAAVGEIGIVGNDLVITVSVIDIRRDLAEYSARAVSPSVTGVEEAIRRLTADLRCQVDGTGIGCGKDDLESAMLMYACGNTAARGDLVSLERNEGLAAARGAKARVRGIMRQQGNIYIDVIWIDNMANMQSDGGYSAGKFKLLSRGDTGTVNPLE